MDRFLAPRLVSSVSRGQVGYGLAVTGDGNGLAVFDVPKEFGQAGLSFSCLNFAHCSPCNLSF